MLQSFRKYPLYTEGGYLYKKENAKKLGLICNYDEVHIYDESKVIDLCPEAGKAKYVLCADAEGKKLTLTKNGQCIFEDEYIPDIRHGIYLVMQEAKVEISKAESDSL